MVDLTTNTNLFSKFSYRFTKSTGTFGKKIHLNTYILYALNQNRINTYRILLKFTILFMIVR